MLFAVLSAGAAGVVYTVAQAATSREPVLTSDARHAVPDLVAKAAGHRALTDVAVDAVAADGRIASFSARTSNGERFVAFGSDDFATPFVPVAQAVRDDLTVMSTSGGGRVASAADWAAVVGVIAPRVQRVVVTTRSGHDHEMQLVRSAFAYSATDPANFATGVRAYDAAGRIIESRELLPPAAPDQQ